MNKLSILPLVLFLLLSKISLATVYTIDSVPNPKFSFSYISDPDSLMDECNRSEINLLLEALEKQTSDQVALVVLNSIGDAVPKDFATALFNKWGIGVAGKDNGLLILIIKDQRRIEFETGYGMEAVLPDHICKRIQEKFMVPRFREGNFDQGIFDGIKATLAILNKDENSSYFIKMEQSIVQQTNTRSPYVLTDEARNSFTNILCTFYIFFLVWNSLSKSAASTFGNFNNEFKVGEKEIKYLVLPKWKWILYYIVIPVIIISGFYYLYHNNDYILILLAVAYLYMMVMAVEKRIRINNYINAIAPENSQYDNYIIYLILNQYPFIYNVIFPVPFLFYYFYYKIRLKKMRNEPRNCKECNTPLIKLNESEDDKYLLANQAFEEKLNSVDYDVWYCTKCTIHEALAYINTNTKYSLCSNCNTVAKYIQSDVIIEQATQHSDGLSLVTFRCNYCKQINREKIVVPSSGSSSESSYSSSGSSSSSSSGSFGGGRSGGGGAGSNW